MDKKYLTIFVLTAAYACAQVVVGANQNTISVTGDAEVKVVPDRANVYLGVESRSKDMAAASSSNDASVRQVIAAVRALGVDSSDIQTDFFHVEIVYSGREGTIVDYYKVTKEIQVVLKNVSRFEELLNTVLRTGANHIYGIEFTTSELRKHRDEARAMAAKAAIEKANDLAAVAGMKVVGSPLPSVLIPMVEVRGTDAVVATAMEAICIRTWRRMSCRAVARDPRERYRSARLASRRT